MTWRCSLLTALVVGCTAAALIPMTPQALRDPELALLLRGMAGIKGVAAIAATALSWWRFARPIAMPVALSMLIATLLMAGGSVLIWRGVHIAPAALAFHTGLALLCVTALRRDERGFAGGSRVLHGWNATSPQSKINDRAER